ncbi:ASCH domain-containing protein [Methylomonas rivi]|uniref:ASCH domain-containing protein n=1 Tax=Methylomonas rivi TaxID=2952226 RepID=A0ABT1U7D4_9GAMM|nr:ASCH domain-containing protein [Methylomonas sp. WSC-6]MBS4050100.1 ASCH domain-containing protein [Methylomonas sp.]MCQ8129290.1 ASCH domain-containing protein [Methylomonas sp. WSC-6]
MTEYPAKTCQIDRLLRQPKLVAAALSGQKTQQRRDGLYAYPGETFELEGETFVVTGVERQRIGDMSEADAQAEGYPSLAMYKDLILKMHANMEWNEDGLVWVHSFKRQQPE